MPGSIMPKFTWLTDDEVKALVAYLQKLGTAVERRKVEVAAAVALPTPESIAWGKTKYQEYCTGCHGEKGDGKGPAGLVLYLAIRSGQFKDPEGIARRMLDME